MSLLPFVKILWPVKIEGALVLTALPSGKSYHLPLHQIDQFDADDERELASINETNCLYFGLGLRRLGLPAAARGGKNDVIALPGIALDIDVESGAAHKSDKLPKTDADVEAILSGSLTPSVVIATGHGYHFYWLFREPWLLSTVAERVAAGDAIKRFQQVFIDRAAGLGFHVDLTASIDRIWRVPGFMNRKDSANPVPVALTEHDPT